MKYVPYCPFCQGPIAPETFASDIWLDRCKNRCPNDFRVVSKPPSDGQEAYVYNIGFKIPPHYYLEQVYPEYYETFGTSVFFLDEAGEPTLNCLAKVKRIVPIDFSNLEPLINRIKVWDTFS